MKGALVLLSVLVLAGCTSAPVVPPPGPPLPARGWSADCAAQFNATEHGVCALFLDPTGAADGDNETHLATHSTEPGTILVTWRVGSFAAPRIFAAVTRDGGRTWATQELRDPSLDANPLTAGRYNFDSIAAFSPDGTARVMYGEVARHEETRTRSFDGLTLASTTDGATWTYQRFLQSPAGTTAPDYMDMAIAPDDGAIHVVSQNFAFAPLFVGPVCQAAPCFVQEGVWHTASRDGGASWSQPQLVMRSLAPVEVHFAARVVAGAGGLVVVTGVGYSGVTGEVALEAAVSRDGGATFAAPAPAFVPGEGDPMFSKHAATWTDASGAAQVGLLFSGQRGMVHVPSPDAAATWGEPVRLDALPPGVDPSWGMAAAAPDGTLYGLQRLGAEERFGALLYRLRPDGAWDHLSLVDAPGVDGRYLRAGDDYGGLAVAADGSVWVAWSDKRTEPPRIAVVRVPPAQG